MNVLEIDLRGRMVAQAVYSELEKIARFKLNDIEDLKKARKQVAEMSEEVDKLEGLRFNPFGEAGKKKKKAHKELRGMQKDLVSAEKDLERRGLETRSRYMKDPDAYTGDADEPDIKKVNELVEGVNKNRTKKRGLFFGGKMKKPEEKKPEVPGVSSSKKPQLGLADRTAKAVGYGAMGIAGLAGANQLYQNKKKSNPYAV